MSFFTVLSFGVGGTYWLGSFMESYKDSSLTPLERERILDHVEQSDDVEAYKALKEYNIATKAFNDKSDTLANSVRKADSLARLNYTTIYQMKEGQSKFFADELRELKRSH